MNKEAFLYKWIRKSTGEFYIGVHKGDINDGYIGSGKIFRDKYDNTDKNDWSREILSYGTLDEMYHQERQIVNHDILKNTLCLNYKIGGYGGSGPISKDHLEKLHSWRIDREDWKDIEFKRSQKISKSLTGRKLSDETKRKISNRKISEEFREECKHRMIGKKFSDETKQRMSEAQKLRHKKQKFSHSTETKKRLSSLRKGKRKGSKWYIFEDGTKVQSVDKTEEKFRSGIPYQKGMKWVEQNV